ncbi:hypothetical protein ABIE65_004390 [Constrictibacter sp. MBR-5]|uniref:hypothetical protein n=1 Tax=Constrictibacter sp. MBR-5 TaxID=3156467 RepID=UPI003390B34A
MQERSVPAARRTPSPQRAPPAARPAPQRAQPRPRSGTLLELAGLALAGGALLGMAAAGSRQHRQAQRPARPARRAAQGAALVAASVLADSAMEHFRGNFRNRAMLTAPAASSAAVAAAVATAASTAAPAARRAAFAFAIAAGLIGIGFHVRNLLGRPGGLSWNSLFYRAPFGAPGALAIAGALGLTADGWPRTAAMPGGDAERLAGITTLGLLGVSVEVGLLHFRGAFHNPLMYLPLAGLPTTGLAVAAAAARPGAGTLAAARAMLGVTTALAVAGSGLHAYGVSRNSGGFANWSQNLFQGPPIAAPPSLAGLALAGFAALDLIEGRRGHEGQEYEGRGREDRHG